jgi:hypothetical protein
VNAFNHPDPEQGLRHPKHLAGLLDRPQVDQESRSVGQ